ncbi:high molecular weight glutenin subunit [Alternaria sp. MG1]|jgi:hypothetical protein|uniref:Uncharacterized protein n=1 Tax=Alternaria tenuissima TaxID=119927 RepID=A0A4Q4PAR0_9PLEO|nr:high molecular weight glutenin subunit [Alternaria sp. MG1]RYN20615.1 hypothetical protein AA0115_g10149 [Alternaria tenuissima]RYN52704.1 hypothetical protein AA0114_g4641 [Alternaria tenuissima]RYN92458.1 hypothetical protein AA0120_g4668 [Alternaria tenuissima]RYN97049.1 hypothetical protein AA0119_g7801 [Alternaria tenuissima]
MQTLRPYQSKRLPRTHLPHAHRRLFLLSCDYYSLTSYTYTLDRSITQSLLYRPPDLQCLALGNATKTVSRVEPTNVPTKSVSLVAQQNVRQHNKFAVAVAVSSKKIAVSGSKTYPQVEVKIISSKAIYKIRVAAGSSAIKAISSRAFSQVKVKASIQTQAVHKVRANNSTLNCLMHTDLDKAAPDVTLSPRSSPPFPSPVNIGPSAPDQYLYPGTPFQVLNPSYTQRPLPEPASAPRQLPKTPPPPVVAFSPGTEAVSRSFDVPK